MKEQAVGALTRSILAQDIGLSQEKELKDKTFEQTTSFIYSAQCVQQGSRPDPGSVGE